ncbi:conserved hypothetical protein [Hyella patelloides LEGE 07179]|uniref:DUF3727 domain-containing protein n=1 Tax=Hyella patelloides LEGE 07179 TaxID=945734 RepID=A0A563VKI9_9CYAN|nr:DUF3727 domain-containing protein [Hyella patelloides]VEP11964.1 conserved hypothetical protein [Hyella patelloides LEGE 07179]
MPSPFDRDKDNRDEEIVSLFDENQRSLVCYVEHSLETDGITYLLLMPVDIPVTIISWESDDPDAEEVEAVMLEDDGEITDIFANAKAVLAEHNLYLKHSAFTLTATGELPPIEEDQILTLNLDEEDSDLDSEELQLLASFYHSERKYSIYTPLTPLLFFARYNTKGKLELVSPEEEGFQPILEELLFEELDDR